MYRQNDHARWTLARSKQLEMTAPKALSVVARTGLVAAVLGYDNHEEEVDDDASRGDVATTLSVGAVEAIVEL